MKDHFQDVHNKNELAFGYMNFLVYLCIDIKEENYAKQRQELGIDKTKFSALEQINVKFGGMRIDGNNTEIYNEKTIIESKIRDFFVNECKA